jgi:hypothetical protein
MLFFDVFERLFDVSRHGSVDLPALIIPIQGVADASSSIPFECDFVVFFKG